MGFGSVKDEAGSTDMRRVQERRDSGKGCGKGRPSKRNLRSKGRCGPRYQGTECSNVGQQSNSTLVTNDAELEVHGGDDGGLPAKGKGKTKSKGHGRKNSVQQQEAIPQKGKGKGKGKGKRTAKGKGNGKGYGADMTSSNAVGKGEGRSKGAGGDARTRLEQGTHPNTVKKLRTRSKRSHGPMMEEHRLDQLMVSLKTSRRDYRFTEYDWECTCRLFYRYNLVKAEIANDACSAAKFTFEKVSDALTAMTELHGRLLNREGREDGSRHNWQDVKFVMHIEQPNETEAFPGSSLDDDSSSPVCAICQEDLNGACEALDCMHAFHRGCALRCVPHIRRLGCPICRLQSPLWLQGLRDTDGSPISEAPSDSESEPEIASRFSSEQVEMLDHSNRMRQESQNLDSDEDFWPQWDAEIEVLRDEFPDLDSDALEDLHEARIQDDCDEFGGYCSGSS